ncbi:MAG: hypothetical protein HQL06_05910 [Nitrospirae bacterium]|nr:hypothetical protein [Nitrospirota bacterium]
MSKKDSVFRIEEIKKYLERNNDKKIEESILVHIKDIEDVIAEAIAKAYDVKKRLFEGKEQKQIDTILKDKFHFKNNNEIKSFMRYLDDELDTTGMKRPQIAGLIFEKLTPGIEEKREKLSGIKSENELCEWFSKNLKTIEKVRGFLEGIVKPQITKYKQIKTIAKHTWPEIKNWKPFLKGKL